MKIRFTAITVVLFCTLLPFVSVAGGLDLEKKEQEVKFQEIDELLFLGENQKALRLLENRSDDRSDPAERLWRLARVHYEMGRLEKENAPRLFKKSEEYARTAIAEDANNSNSFKWLAIALGARAKYSDTKAQVRQSREIKESIEKAIVLNPDDDIAYLVLSRWHYKVSNLGAVARAFAKIIYGGIPKASLAKAEELLWQAIELNDRISHRYNLAKVYKRMDKQKQAEEQLRMALLLQVTFPEEAEELEKARNKLKE